MSYQPRESGPHSVLDFPLWREEDSDVPGRETYPIGELLSLTLDRTIDHGVFSGSFPIDDTTTLVRDPVDNTKTVRIDVGAVAASTTRILTMPDRNVDLSAGGTFADLTDTVLRDGTQGLTADWDVGPHEVRAQTFHSDATGPTAPLVIASAVLTTNLNADLLDGNHATAFAVAAHTHTLNEIQSPDAQTSFVMPADNDIVIDGTTNPRTIDTGVMRWEQTPTIENTRCLTCNVDANSQPNSHAMVVNLLATGIATGETISAYSIAIDPGTATGGIARGFEMTVAGGNIAAHALHAGIGVAPVTQHSGSFINVEQAWDYDGGYTDVTAACNSSGTDVELFTADTDVLYIGMAATFDQIEVLLATQASGAGIRPTFEFSAGAGSWTVFTPVDDSRGFRDPGVITWTSGDLTGWSTDTVNGVGSKYWIRITRTRNALVTAPTEDTIQVAVTIDYEWDEDGDISCNTLTTSGIATVAGIGDGGLTSYDLLVGDVTTPDYGMIRFGNAVIGRTSYNVANIDLDGAILIRNIGGPVTGEIEAIFTESTGNTCRFAIPKSGVGNATYNARSFLNAGPAPADTDFVKVSYWQTQGIFHNLVCDTAGSGADMGVQNDLEVEGNIYVDDIVESTTAAGVTIEGVLIKDGLTDGIDLAANGATAAAGLTDNTVLRGDGGGTGIQDSGVLLDDSDNMLFPAGGSVRLGASTTGIFESVGSVQYAVAASKFHIFFVNTVAQVAVTDGAFYGATNNDIDLGIVTTNEFKDGFFAGEVLANTFQSDVATGTAPLTVASTTVVPNLNVDQVDGKDSTDLVLVDGTQALTASWDAGPYNIRMANLRIDTVGDGGVAGAMTIGSQVSTDVLTGAAATNRTVAAGKEVGPAAAAAAGWWRIYDGTTPRWIQVWT